jgi:hypothetical protein
MMAIQELQLTLSFCQFLPPFKTPANPSTLSRRRPAPPRE